MPWLAVPIDQPQIKQKLAETLKTQGIPSLVILDAKTGFYVTNNARNEVASTGGGDNEEKGKDIISSWKATEAVPIELASFGGGGFSWSSIFWYVARNPAFIFLVVFIFKKIFRYVAALTQKDSASQQEF